MDFLKNENTTAIVKIIIAMTIFGSVGIFAPLTGLKSMELVFVRCMGGIIFLGTGWLVSGNYKNESWNQKDLILAGLCSVSLVANWIFLFKAFETTSITLAVSIYYLAPIIVMLFGIIFFKEKLTLLAGLSILMCFSAQAFISEVHKVSLVEFRSSGAFWSFLAAVFYAIVMIINQKITKISAFATSAIQVIVGGLLLASFISFEAFYELSFQNWFFILCMGLIHTGLVYILFFGSIRKLTSKQVAILVFIDPLSAILFDSYFNGFSLSSPQLLGVSLMFVGLMISSMDGLRSKAKT